MATKRDTDEVRESVSDAHAMLGLRYGATPADDSDMADLQHSLVLPKDRIIRLTDGIFAIAMTLLVLGIQVPTFPVPVTAAEFSAYVIGILPEIATYMVSFILLAIFWLDHHIFFKIKRTNTILTWINVLWLMAITFVPFSTSLVGRYGQFQLAQLIFDLNMLAIGVLWYLNWQYASDKGMIDEQVAPYAGHIRRSNLALPVLAVLAILASFVTSKGVFVFLAAPIIFILYTASKRRISGGKLSGTYQRSLRRHT